VYEFQVKPGWKEGTKVKFKQQSGFPPMIFVLKEKKHKYYTRYGDDLVCKIKLTPSQAENGARIRIPLLSGKIEIIEILDDKELPIIDGSKRVISGKGMVSKSQEKGYRGDLIVEFHILNHNNVTSAAA